MRLEGNAGAGSERGLMAARAGVVMVREKRMVMVRLGHEVGEGSIVERQDEEGLTGCDCDCDAGGCGDA